MKNTEKMKTPIMNVYSVCDTVAGRYSPPFLAANDRAAQRDFHSACTDGNSMMSKNPLDYHLFRIGTFDHDDGQLEVEVHDLVCTGNIVDK